MGSRGLFGWSPPHVQPLTPVSEVSEPPESPSPYMDLGAETSASQQMEAEEEMEEMEDIEPPPASLALTIVYIAGGVFVAGWIEVSCWILTGERQTAVIRSKYVRVLLNQDMSFFDTYGNNGDIVSQVLSDVLLIQSALSEKVGNYIHNMATFFSGLVIAFINCWQIALITLATGPFIVAAGGISNIFLHRLAENIQDAYAEAASIAEQAVSYIRTLSAFTNETLAKYSYATSLQATLRYGILISLVQGLGLGFTYGLAICSCALQLWVGRFLVIHGKAHGEVLLDGENIKNLKLEWLRSQIGLVTQEPALLSLSIRDNIAYGRDTTMDQIEEAAKIAHAHTFISSLDKGYDTQNADYIAVMEEGQLVEMGTHDELLTLGGLYAELLRCEEATKLPKRMPARNYKKTAAFQIEKDSSESHSCKEPSSPRMMKSPSLQRISAVFRPSDGFFNLQDSPQVQSPPPEKMMENGQSLDSTEKEPSIKRQDSFEMRLPELPKIDVQSVHRQTSNGSDPESPVSPLLTSDPKNERSHSQTFSRPDSYSDEFSVKMNETKDARHRDQPSFWRLAELSFAEWLYAVLGSIGAAIFGAFNPLLAYVIGLVVTTYYKIDKTHHLRGEIDKWCLLIACMGIVTVVANFLQHFYFGIMGEKMTERVRRMMFSAMLRNEIGWYDDEENSADNLSMRLANDATFVRAAFSNRLSIFIQDIAAVIVAFLIGVLLHWRIALVALATLPVLCVSAVAQKLWLAGFSRGIQEMHRKASLVLEDAVRNIYTVVAFCAGNKVMELYRLQLNKIFTQSFLHGLAIGFAFGFSQFLLFACNALLLWYTAICIKNKYVAAPTALKEYIVFSFATFALVEPFGLAPYILKRRKSLISVFEIIDRVPKIDPDDNSALKPPNVYGSIELKNVDFCYPTRPEVLVLSNFSLKVSGGQTIAVVGVSGSGKSTIISLMERYYDPVAGQVLLDGRDLKLYNLKWLRSHLGLVQQEPVIFSTTIRENIIYARHNAIVLNGGRIVEEGTHDSLVAKNGLWRVVCGKNGNGHAWVSTRHSTLIGIGRGYCSRNCADLKIGILNLVGLRIWVVDAEFFRRQAV
ncbi:hypothetical protein TSUD_01320 [Trifolium subterraneum]|nr:hypothetical protein TSUD_01320 [Trifolium subterraneum]